MHLYECMCACVCVCLRIYALLSTLANAVSHLAAGNIHCCCKNEKKQQQQQTAFARAPTAFCFWVPGADGT